MPVLPWRSLAGLPRYAAGYSGMMELAALCGVPGGVALGRGTPFKAPSRSAGIGFGPQLSLFVPTRRSCSSQEGQAVALS